jgi:hypothetical protein
MQQPRNYADPEKTVIFPPVPSVRYRVPPSAGDQGICIHVLAR